MKMKWLKLCTNQFVSILYLALMIKCIQAQYRQPNYSQQQQNYGQNQQGYTGTYYPGPNMYDQNDRRTTYNTPGSMIPPPPLSYDSFGWPIVQPGGVTYPQPPGTQVRFRNTCNFPSLGQLSQVVSVHTRLGEVIGKYEYLCDSPEANRN